MADSNGSPKDRSPTGDTASYACTRCSKRKVKCERRLPACIKCVDANVECIYVAPPPPRRRQRWANRATASSTAAKLKRYEELLQAHGIPFGNDDPGHYSAQPLSLDHASSIMSQEPEVDDMASMNSCQPRIKCEMDDGNELWSFLTEAAPESYAPLPMLDHHDVDGPLVIDADPLWGANTRIDIGSFWPRSDLALLLWRLYVERFHPIVKMVHAPSVEKLILKDVDHLSCAEKSLVYAVFATAVETMTVAECEVHFNNPRPQVLRRYRTGARYALANANFLFTTEFMVLQALVIFLMSMRHEYDASPMWSLTGIAIRNGKRIGLDRADTIRGPLESLERQWVWFNLLYIDAYIAECAGVRQPWLEMSACRGFNILNLDDRDLFRGMTELPPEKDGATDVMFNCLRSDWVRGAQKARLPHMFNLRADESANDSKPIRTQAIDELEDLFARKYVRHCDPTVPMQLLLLLTSKCMILNLRLSKQRQDRDHAIQAGLDTSKETERMFEMSLKILEYSFMIQGTESLQRFYWHLRDQLPRPAAVFVVGELRIRTDGPGVDKAWQQVERCFSQHPDIVTHARRPWIRQLGSLVLEAWEARETFRCQHMLPEIMPPDFIVKLRNGRDERLISGESQAEMSNSGLEQWYPIADLSSYPWIGADFESAAMTTPSMQDIDGLYM